MKIENVKNGGFYIGTAPYNWNTVIITDVGQYGPLKVLANSKKYFTGYYPDFFYVNGSKIRKLTKAELKQTFKNALDMDPKYFSAAEISELGNIFKVKVETFLSAKGWHKDHYNYNKREKYETPPAKRKTPARNARRTGTSKRR